MMRATVTVLVAAGLLGATSAGAEPRYEQDVALQRGSLDAWTGCIAAERAEEVDRILSKDFNSEGYKLGLKALAQTRVSKDCFDAMPRQYRSIRLGGLPFAGGLAEHRIESGSEPLLKRLAMAALGKETSSFSATDRIASCVVRGAPDLVAALFATKFETSEERAALAKVSPVADVCAGGAGKFEASALGLRSMLATASFRLLAAQKVNSDA